MRAVDAVMECLKAEGVDVVFGLPGGANIPTYDALHDAGIRHVLVRHEAGGGHAAEGYAKATGKVGVCLATSGPGATNVVTPIQDAMMDSVPTVFITGQVRTDLLGTDGFQEADVLGITMPAVKHSFMIQHPLEIPRAMHEAFYLARTGRPGPVVIDIPTDLSRADIPYEPVNEVRLPGYQPTTEGNTKQIRQAAKALAASRRPVIYAGGGVVNANAAAELVELTTADRFPITCTLMGLGAFPASHDQWLGMPGMHGTRTANYAMDEADLICAVGARFDDRVTGKLSEFAPRAKFIHIDIDPAEIPRVVHEAFHIARTGRPGPVLIDLPVDLTRAEIDYEPVGDVRLPGYQPTTEGNSKQIRLAAKALANARRPVLYAGGGVINADASAELTELALSDRFPVTCTLMGLGAFPAPHAQWLGMLGMHGTRAANYAMDEADLIVALGARFDDRITGKLSEFAPRAKFIHVDIDPAEISKNVPAHIPIVGDAKNILQRLVTEYRATGADPARLAAWWERIEGWRAQHPLRYDDSPDTEIKPQALIEALYEATGGEAVVASDVGQHQMWTAQYFHFSRPRRWINSGGLGTMGFGLPAGMGAAVARPDVPTIVVTGDGSIQMNAQELATCTEHRIPVKVFIANNGYLGMVRQWQELFWDKRYSHVDMGQWPDFVKLAEAYGATGVLLNDKTSLVDDLRAALATPGPVVVDVRVTREENTYPMIAPGAAARDMVG